MKCQDCKGTGQYQGLFIVEPCQTCRGSGIAGAADDSSSFYTLGFHRFSLFKAFYTTIETDTISFGVPSTGNATVCKSHQESLNVLSHLKRRYSHLDLFRCVPHSILDGFNESEIRLLNDVWGVDFSNWYIVKDVTVYN